MGSNCESCTSYLSSAVISLSSRENKKIILNRDGGGKGGIASKKGVKVEHRKIHIGRIFIAAVSTESNIFV